MASQVTLFDLPSKDGNMCWSLNPWKSKSLVSSQRADLLQADIATSPRGPELQVHPLSD